jgi:predicted DNA-binding transcriptional regulator YafY
MPGRTRAAPARQAPTKIQRWTDLVAALLARRTGATFLELTEDVPAYAAGRDPDQKDTVKRAFERDKDELREFGIRIETIASEESEDTRYRLRATDFYLPYLALTQQERARFVPPAGYRDVGIQVLTPDDLELIGEAVARLEKLGDPTLAEDARSAANKIAFDLPLFDHVRSDVRILDGDTGADAKVFEVLADALRRRKVVTFDYHKPGDAEPSKRSVEPYGLVFISAHWYLAAKDPHGLRNFRVSRIRNASANRTKPQSPDYEIPAAFRLRDHAKAREAWELGDADAVVAEVLFTGHVIPSEARDQLRLTGAAAAAMRAGEPVAGDAARRRYDVRRLDTFARWLVSLAGEARPVSPPELVDRWRKAISDTLALYGRGQ